MFILVGLGVYYYMIRKYIVDKNNKELCIRVSKDNKQIFFDIRKSGEEYAWIFLEKEDIELLIEKLTKLRNTLK